MRLFKIGTPGIEIDTLRKTKLFPVNIYEATFFKNEPNAFAYFIYFGSPKTVFEVFYRQWEYGKKYKQ